MTTDYSIVLSFIICLVEQLKRTVFCVIFSLYFSDVNLLGYDGRTPLHIAAMSLEIEEELEKTHISLGIKQESEPQKIFSEYFSRSILRILLENKANVNMQDNKNRTPLHYAVMRNHIHIIQELINSGSSWHVSLTPFLSLFEFYHNR